MEPSAIILDRDRPVGALLAALVGCQQQGADQERSCCSMICPPTPSGPRKSCRPSSRASKKSAGRIRSRLKPAAMIGPWRTPGCRPSSGPCGIANWTCIEQQLKSLTEEVAGPHGQGERPARHPAIARERVGRHLGGVAGGRGEARLTRRAEAVARERRTARLSSRSSMPTPTDRAQVADQVAQDKLKQCVTANWPLAENLRMVETLTAREADWPCQEDCRRRAGDGAGNGMGGRPVQGRCGRGRCQGPRGSPRQGSAALKAESAELQRRRRAHGEFEQARRKSKNGGRGSGRGQGQGGRTGTVAGGCQGGTGCRPASRCPSAKPSWPPCVGS